MPLAVCSLCLCVGMLLSSPASAADSETAAEKLRKALDQVRDLQINEQPLDAAINQLHEQTGINLVLDRTNVPPTPSQGFTGMPLPSYGHLSISGQFHHVPLRAALTTMLREHNLTHVLVGDTVLITAPDKAAERQLGQTVSVNIEETTLSAALRQLARETGANLVLDPRSAKEGQTALTLRLDEVALETAVELLADEADLRVVRLRNVLYVTSEARALKLRKPRPATAASSRGWQIQQDNNGGFRVTPLTKSGDGSHPFDDDEGFQDAVAQSAPQTPPPPKKDTQAATQSPKPKTMPQAQTKESLANKMARCIHFFGLDDPKTTLSEALEMVSKRYDVRFEINDKAFQFEHVMEVGKTEIVGSKPIPEMKNAPLEAVVTALLARVPSPSGAAFRLRSDRVEITTNAFLNDLKKLTRKKALKDNETPALPAASSARDEELRHLLNKPIHLGGFDDPKNTFSDILEALTQRYNLSFDMNKRAFKEADMEQVRKIEVTSSVPIPAMHTRLRTVLKKILSRVSPSATYIVRNDTIEITTMQAIREEFCPDRPDGPLPPLVSGVFEKVSLAAALKELAYEGNIVLDSRAAKEAEITVSADFSNVPLDTAVRMLADMAGLKVVPLDNVLYVTREDNARLLMEEQEKLHQQRQREKKEKADKAAEKKSNEDEKRENPKK